MIHKPASGWRVLVLHYQDWRRSWVWRSIFLARCTDPYMAIYRYVSMRQMVRQHMWLAMRLIAPDGTVAAEEYATHISRESRRGDRLVLHKAHWPKAWKVRGGLRYDR